MAEVRGVKFELKMRTFKFVKELTGVTVINEVFERLQRKADTIDDVDYIVQVLRACHRTANEKSSGDYIGEDEAYEWLDEWTPQELEGLFSELLKVFSEKKVMASEKGASQ